MQNMTNSKEPKNKSQNYFRNKSSVIRAKMKNSWEKSKKITSKKLKVRKKLRKIHSRLLTDFKNSIERQWNKSTSKKIKKWKK